MVDWRILTVLSVALVLSGIMLSGTNIPITGNFYMMDEANSSYEQKYESINWSERPETGEFYGARHSEALENLTSVEINFSIDSITLSNKEYIVIEGQSKNKSEINFSEKILGLNKTYSLEPDKKINLRLREDLKINYSVKNQTYKISVQTTLKNDKTVKENINEKNISQAIRTYNLTYSRNITDTEFNLTNNLNKTVNLSYPDNFTARENFTEVLGPGEEAIYEGLSEQKISLESSNTTKRTELQRINVLVYQETVQKTDEVNSNQTSVSKDTAENETIEGNLTSNNSSQEIKQSDNITSNLTEEDENKSENTTEENYTESNESIQVENNTETSLDTEAGKLVQIESERVEDFKIFKYEASRRDANSTSEGQSNIPVSQKGVKPWKDISQVEASNACQSLGENYRLPTNNEWQEAALSGNISQKSGELEGNTENSATCRTYSDGRTRNLCLTGSGPETWKNKAGVYDMKGNLWEWTGTVVDASEIELSGESGYISDWNEEKSRPESLSDEKVGEFDDSFFYASPEGKRATRKGGGKNGYGGTYTTVIDRKPNYSSKAYGFRCVYNQ